MGFHGLVAAPSRLARRLSCLRKGPGWYNGAYPSGAPPMRDNQWAISHGRYPPNARRKENSLRRRASTSDCAEPVNDSKDRFYLLCLAVGREQSETRKMCWKTSEKLEPADLRQGENPGWHADCLLLRFRFAGCVSQAT